MLRTVPPLPWFVVQITAALGGDEYTFIEVWLSEGTWQEKIGGRYGTAENPGVALEGVSFAVDDYALCRSSEGEGGSKWELFPVGGELVTFLDSTLTSGASFVAITADETWQDTGLELTADKTGWYLLNAAACMSGTASLVLQLRAHITVGGAEVNSAWMSAGPSGNYGTIPLSMVVHIEEGEVVKLQMWRAAGSWTSCGIWVALNLRSFLQITALTRPTSAGGFSGTVP